MRSKPLYLSGGPVSGQKQMIAADVFEIVVEILDTDTGSTEKHLYRPPSHNKDSLVYLYVGVVKTMPNDTVL